MNRTHLLAIAFIILGIFAGIWITKDAIAPSVANSDHKKPPYVAEIDVTPPRDKSLGKRLRGEELSRLEKLITIDGERLVRFNSEEAYLNALSRLGDSGAKLLGRMDRFHALRLSTDDLDRLRDWLGEDGEDFANYLVSLPLVPDTNVQFGGGVPFGRTALEFLGITGDNSTWGEGVKVAVVDTGVQPHLSLDPNKVSTITIDGVPEVSEAHGHGTAVASIISGNHDSLTGVAPSAEIISIPVTDASGNSNSFLLAEGISAAVENGAQVINVSMGSYGDSLIVQEAVAFAIENGAIVIASVGNEGFNQAAFPARNEGVVSVGSIDASGSYVPFSNTSETLSTAAPGYEVLAAWPGDQAIAFTGTSASAPFVSATIAAIISQSDVPLTGQQAWEIAQGYLNEAGAPGPDIFYGEGLLHTGRIILRDTPGISDLAVAEPFYNFERNLLQVTIENRGTEPIFNSSLAVGADGGNYPFLIPTLQPNERRVIELPIQSPELNTDGLLHVTSQTVIGGGVTDALPSNNQRTDVISAPASATDGP